MVYTLRLSFPGAGAKRAQPLCLAGLQVFCTTLLHISRKIRAVRSQGCSAGHSAGMAAAVKWAHASFWTFTGVQLCLTEGEQVLLDTPAACCGFARLG